MATASYAGNQSALTLDEMLQDGLIPGGAYLETGMGELVKTLIDSGVASAENSSMKLVTVGDDLAAALHEAGMLYALPDAGVQIDAGKAHHLQTSLKAMADIGVDHVLAKAGAQIDLGEAFNIGDLNELLSHFVQSESNDAIKTIFDDSAAAELNIGNADGYSAATLESLFDSEIGEKLLDLGIHKLVAQVEVQILGSSGYESFELDLDDLIKKPV